MSVRSTSINTYHDIKEEGLVGKRQLEVLELFSELDHPITDMELAEKLHYDDPNNVRPRRKELYDLGIIKEDGKRVCSITDRLVYQWCIIDGLNINTVRENKNKLKNKIKCPMCKGSGFVIKKQTSLEAY